MFSLSINIVILFGALTWLVLTMRSRRKLNLGVVTKLKQKIYNQIFSSKPVLKEEYIKKLEGYEMEGKPLLNILAEEYFEKTPRLLDNLEVSILNEDIKQVQYFSHTLKSSSLILGLVDLSQLCQKLEIMNRIEPAAKIIFTQIRESYEKSEPLLRKRIQVHLS